jgi:hypothetical protein
MGVRSMFMGRAMMVAAAASAAAIPTSWEPVPLGEWWIEEADGACTMMMPLG